MLEVGTFEAEIIEHGLRCTSNGTDYVHLLVRVLPAEDSLAIFMWLTDKSIRIARAGLKKCGFDPDTTNLSELDSNPRLLAGNRVTVSIEENEYKGETRLQGRIVVDDGPSKKRVKELQAMIRKAKKRDETEPPPPEDDDNVPF